MNDWYNNLTKDQRVFIFWSSLIVPFIMGAAFDSIGVMLILYFPLLGLTYLYLGNKNKN